MNIPVFIFSGWMFERKRKKKVLLGGGFSSSSFTSSSGRHNPGSWKASAASLKETHTHTEEMLSLFRFNLRPARHRWGGGGWTTVKMKMAHGENIGYNISFIWVNFPPIFLKYSLANKTRIPDSKREREKMMPLKYRERKKKRSFSPIPEIALNWKRS